MVREPILEWLRARRTADLVSSAEMQDSKRIMLMAWLGATDDPGAVLEDVVQWLAAIAGTPG